MYEDCCSFAEDKSVGWKGCNHPDWEEDWECERCSEYYSKTDAWHDAHCEDGNN